MMAQAKALNDPFTTDGFQRGEARVASCARRASMCPLRRRSDLSIAEQFSFKAVTYFFFPSMFRSERIIHLFALIYSP